MLSETASAGRRPQIDDADGLPPLGAHLVAGADMGRLLVDRFSNQGLVHHELSRACLAVSPDAVPRIVLLGRLSLWGSVAARWIEPAIRRTALQPYAREAERQTMEALDHALDMLRRFAVPAGQRERLLDGLAGDVAELLPEVQRRAEAAAAAAKDRLGERGMVEAASLRALLENQRRRIERELDIRAWRARLTTIGREIGFRPNREQPPPSMGEVGAKRREGVFQSDGKPR
jgi:hypothetical protein